MTPPASEACGLKGPEWVGAALAEYHAHRAEVLAEAQAQQQTLALGATAVGVLVAGGFNVWDDRLLATIAFLAAIPLLCVLVLVQWVGRSFGLMTAGAYLEVLENELRNAYPEAPASILRWERTLADRRPPTWWKPHYAWNDFGAFAVFVLLAAGSIALGAYRGYGGKEVLITAVAIVQSALLLLLTVSLARSLATVRQRARRDFPRSRTPTP